MKMEIKYFIQQVYDDAGNDVYYLVWSDPVQGFRHELFETLEQAERYLNSNVLMGATP